MRAKRSAASRDALPDEAFLRLRGALFFGPGFKVTRNKLLFRDNLQELLAAAVPGTPLLYPLLWASAWTASNTAVPPAETASIMSGFITAAPVPIAFVL